MDEKDYIMDKKLKSIIENISSKLLTPRELDVLNMRFGLGEYNGKTFTLLEVGLKYDVTR